MKKTARTALQNMEACKAALEAEILRLCNQFEDDTGLRVIDVRHPRRNGYMAHAPLDEKARVEVGTVSPFMYLRDHN